MPGVACYVIGSTDSRVAQIQRFGARAAFMTWNGSWVWPPVWAPGRGVTARI